MASRKRLGPIPTREAVLDGALARHWFEDGEPTWIERAGSSWERPCRTSEEARELRERFVRLLHRHAQGDQVVMSLADRLAECSPRHRCMSGACPECARAQQRWFVETAGQVMIDASGEGTMYMVSLVPEFGQYLMPELPQLDLGLVNRRALRLLKATGVELAVGATDFSVNVDAPGCMPYVQVQYILFTPSKEELLDRSLRRALSPTGTVRRPVRTKEFDGDNTGLAYALKYEFVQREVYFQVASSRGDGRSSRNTRNRPLRGQRWVSIMLLLDRTGLGGRVALLGVRRTMQDGMLSMRLIR